MSAPGSMPGTSITSSTLFLPPSPPAWGWDWPFASQSWRPTAAQSGQLPNPAREPRFSSRCRPSALPSRRNGGGGQGGRPMTEPAPIVFVVDDDPSVRKALARLLKSALLPVEVFASAQEFLERPLPDAPACLILDVRMPGLDGLDLQSALAERNSSLPIIFVSGRGNIATAVRAMKGGAVDFLTKPVNDQELLMTVRRALARHAQARQAGAELAGIRQRAQGLSQREREVMALVVSGLLNKQAGYKLGITEKTIKVHRAQVMHKMGANSLPELVRMAERMELRA